jgi:hypothetical protein
MSKKMVVFNGRFTRSVYETIMDFSDGLASFEINKKHGYMDKKGNIVIKPNLSYVTDFSDGIAPVALSDSDWFATEWTYIDKKGSPIGSKKFNYHALSEALEAPDSVIGANFKFNGKDVYSYKKGRFIGMSNNEIGYWNKFAKPIVLYVKKYGEEFLINGEGKIIWPADFKPKKNSGTESTKGVVAKDKKPAFDYKPFRTSLKEGDSTHCGLVIEVKKVVVKVQTIVGEHWFKINQLFPEGSADCRFVNNIYQEP